MSSIRNCTKMIAVTVGSLEADRAQQDAARTQAG